MHILSKADYYKEHAQLIGVSAAGLGFVTTVALAFVMLSGRAKATGSYLTMTALPVTVGGLTGIAAFILGEKG